MSFGSMGFDPESPLHGRTVVITYHLSQKGQKESIRQGGDGRMEQTLVVPLTEEILVFAFILPDGSAVLDVGNNPRTSFDSPQTVESLIAWEKERLALERNRLREMTEKRAHSAWVAAEKKRWEHISKPLNCPYVVVLDPTPRPSLLSRIWAWVTGKGGR